MAQSYRKMPAPPERRLTGHLGEWVGVKNARSVLQRMQRYAAYGPVTRADLPPLRLVVVSDPEVASKALSAPQTNYKGLSYILTRVVLDNVLLLNGAAWAEGRKSYRAALKRVDPLAAAERLSARFAGELARRRTPEPIALDETIHRLIGNVVADFVAGVELPERLEPDRRRIQHELAAVGIDLQCQPWAYLSPLRWIRLQQSVARMRGFFRQAVERRLSSAGEPRGDILDGFVALARAGEIPNDVETIQEGVVNFFFTAHDVLASSVTWCLHLLATHSEAQAKLRASLARGEDDELHRVTRESLRLYPGYSLFGRTTQDDLELGGYEVPAGTLLLFSPYVSHRLERYWPDPLAFDPSRWSAPGERPGYFPFGAGPRSCMASHLAVPLLKIVVAELVRRLELRAADGHRPEIAYWGTTYSQNGLPTLVRATA
jgi:cytochrome P450